MNPFMGRLARQSAPPPQVGGGDVATRTALAASLQTNYDPQINPDNPQFQLGLVLISVDLNDKHSILESDVWLTYSWQDSRLAWDTNTFAVNLLELDFDKVWRPDLNLYYSAGPFSTGKSCTETKVMIYPTGNVVWIPVCRLRSLCKNTVKMQPYMPQTCSLKFGPWAYNNATLGIDFYNNQTTVDMSQFQDVTDWNVISTSGVTGQQVYQCCSEIYADVTYNITLQRKPDYGAWATG